MKTSLRIVLGIVILAIIIYFLRGIDFKEVYSLLIEANNIYFLLAFLSYGVAILAFNLRSVYSISSIIKTGYWFNLKATLGGNFINVVTPGAQIGGEPVRAYFIGKKYKSSATKIFGAILADRFFHALVSLIFILASAMYILTIVEFSPELKATLQTILLITIIIISLFILISLSGSKKSGKRILKFIEKRAMINSKDNKNNKTKEFKEILAKHSKNTIQAFYKTLKNKKIILAGMILSLVHWIFVYSSSYFLFLSFDMYVSFFIVLAVVSLGSIVGDFSPTPGGFGLVEGFMILMYSALGINLAAAFAVSVLSRMITYFFHLVLGGISILNLNKEIGKLT